MEAHEIEVGKLYWIAGMGPMTVMGLAQPPRKTTYTLQQWPRGVYWAGLEQFVGPVSDKEMKKYREEYNRAMGPTKVFAKVGTFAKCVCEVKGKPETFQVGDKIQARSDHDPRIYDWTPCRVWKIDRWAGEAIYFLELA